MVFPMLMSLKPVPLYDDIKSPNFLGINKSAYKIFSPSV
ncbi:hypothetical protein FLJU110815_21285 [Flavobacterium jumunjinense]